MEPRDLVMNKTPDPEPQTTPVNVYARAYTSYSVDVRKHDGLFGADESKYHIMIFK